MQARGRGLGETHLPAFSVHPPRRALRPTFRRASGPGGTHPWASERLRFPEAAQTPLRRSRTAPSRPKTPRIILETPCKTTQDAPKTHPGCSSRRPQTPTSKNRYIKQMKTYKLYNSPETNLPFSYCNSLG